MVSVDVSWRKVCGLPDNCITVHAKISGAVYCNQSCLCVCGFVCLFVALFVCGSSLILFLYDVFILDICRNCNSFCCLFLGQLFAVFTFRVQ